MTDYTRGVKSEQMSSRLMCRTRRRLEEARTRFAVAMVVSVLLPLAVLVVAGALAGHRRWVLMQSLRE
jgi:hypothetical protein